MFIAFKEKGSRGREREKKRERERNIDVGVREKHGYRTCPDWEWDPQPFNEQDDAPTN